MDTSAIFPLLGQLEIIEDLFWYDGPLFFVCKADNGKLLLTICISREQNEYIATEINDEIINDIKNNKTEMRQPFLKPIGDLYHFYHREYKHHDKTDCKKITINQLPIDMLPPEGAYLNKTME